MQRNTEKICFGTTYCLYEKCKLSNLNVKKIPCRVNPENVDEIYEQFVKGVDR